MNEYLWQIGLVQDILLQLSSVWFLIGEYNLSLST